MATKKKSAKLDKWATEAAMQALLKYGPEESGLNLLQQQAQDTYATGVKQARGTGESTIAAIDAAKPQVAQIYDPTLQAASRSQSLVGKDLAGLSGVADSIKAGASTEAAQQLANLGSARASALEGLSSRRVAAREGVQYATESARRQFVDDLSKVLSRKQDLAGEKGTFTALTSQQLHDAADQRAQQLDIANSRNTQSERNSVRSSGIDPNTGLPIPGGKADTAAKNRGKVSATGVKLLTGGEQRGAASAISSALAAIQTLDPDKSESRSDIAPLLLSGHKGQPVYETVTDPATGKPKRQAKLTKAGTPVVTPDIPKVDGLLASAALDVYYTGYVSRATQKKLANAGYSVKQLGLTTYADWLKTGRKPVTAKGVQTQQAIGSLISGLGSLTGK